LARRGAAAWGSGQWSVIEPSEIGATAARAMNSMRREKKRKRREKKTSISDTSTFREGSKS